MTVSYVRHFQPFAQLTAVALIDGEVHQLPIAAIESRVLADGAVQYHPVCVWPDGEVASLVDRRREQPDFRYRIEVSARLASEQRRNELESDLRKEST